MIPWGSFLSGINILLLWYLFTVNACYLLLLLLSAVELHSYLKRLRY